MSLWAVYIPDQPLIVLNTGMMLQCKLLASVGPSKRGTIIFKMRSRSIGATIIRASCVPSPSQVASSGPSITCHPLFHHPPVTRCGMNWKISLNNSTRSPSSKITFKIPVQSAHCVLCLPAGDGPFSYFYVSFYPHISFSPFPLNTYLLDVQTMSEYALYVARIKLFCITCTSNTEYLTIYS